MPTKHFIWGGGEN